MPGKLRVEKMGNFVVTDFFENRKKSSITQKLKNV